MRIIVLGSGSSGNSTYVEMGGMRLLIDVGLNCKQLVARMEEHGIDPAGLDGIFLTHEHTDHVQGLATFLKKYPTEVFATEGTATVCERQLLLAKKPIPEFVIFQARVPFALGALWVTPIAISHDVADPVAYTFSDEGEKLGYFTDLGFVSEEVALAFAECTHLILESNHDPEMLRCSSRPFQLIMRISGTSGHLSNEQAATALASNCPAQLKTVTLAHLSGECNDPQLALAMMRAALERIGRKDVVIQCASQACSCVVCDCSC